MSASPIPAPPMVGSAERGHWVPHDLSGMVVLVSGGGRGVGRLLAHTLSRRGAAVGLIARSADELARVVEEISGAGGIAAAATADVSDEAATAAAVAALRQRFGPITTLINNAGISGPVDPLWDADPRQWWRTIEVNLGGAFALTRVVLPEMICARGGRIINITSNAGVHRWPLVSAYVASKAALVKLSETLAAETRRHGVAVFSVDPGLLPIGLGESALASTADPETAAGRVFGWIRSQLSSGHGADPERAARLILELTTGKGDRLSGRHLTADDDLDTLLTQIEEIEFDDLHRLRVPRRPQRRATPIERSPSDGRPDRSPVPLRANPGSPVKPQRTT
jgi:NAD(P)-dependent dehydrogenase (short-subunit alcohol dehydrogenase family)